MFAGRVAFVFVADSDLEVQFAFSVVVQVTKMHSKPRQLLSRLWMFACQAQP